MSRTVEIPEEISERAAKMAAEAQVSFDDFVLNAIVDQIRVRDRFARRAARSTPESFSEALAQIPDAEPEEDDRLH